MNRSRLQRLMRLRAMSPGEISYRLRAALRSGGDRLRFHLHALNRAEEGLGRRQRSFCSKQYLQQSPARRFYLPKDEQAGARLRHFIETHFPEWKCRAIEEAERLCRHRVELLGYGEVHLGPQIDWHRDPITGQRWPLRFWADYDLVRDAGAGDPKTVHELNRHQHLPRLAKAYFLTGEERYAQEAVRQLTGWIEQNPAGVGIHWHSSLEISLRVISWLWTIFFLLPAKSFDEAAAQRVMASLFRQIEHVCRYPSIYSSPNTHLLGEATALYLAGVLFAEYSPADRWRKSGQSLLAQEIERQVSAEGIHGELSSYYHCYALDFCLQVLALAMRNELSWPKPIWQRVEAMTEFLMHLSGPDGSIPLLGDDDGGRALALGQTHYRSFPDALCAGAVLYGRKDFKHVAGELREETLWLLGETAGQEYRSMPGSRPGPLQAPYPAGGYYIQRSDWGQHASHLVFDCGGMGMGRGGHGHADALSIVLSAGGKELLVDPGTGIYNSAPEWRAFFRSSRAHNTALVDGLEQSAAAETFSWKNVAETRVLRKVVLPEVEYIEGEHRGYCRLPQGIVHRRGVLYCRPHCWVIVDRFLGEGTHRFDLLYHFPPRAEVAVCGPNSAQPQVESVVQAGSAGLRFLFCSPVPAKAAIVCGRSENIQGWTSRRYGAREASPTLQVSLEAAAPTAVLSVLLPFSVDREVEAARHAAVSCAARQPAMENGTAVACALESGDHRDLWVVPMSDGGAKLLEYEMRGEFFWVRREAGGLHRVFALNAVHLSHQGHSLIDNGTARAGRFLRWGEDGKGAEQHQEEEKGLCVESAAL